MCITPVRMTIPYWLYTTVGDKPEGNPSMFMVDSPLWTVCRESREMMRRTFKPDIPLQSVTASFISLPSNSPSGTGDASSGSETASLSLGTAPSSLKTAPCSEVSAVSTSETASSTLENATSVQRRYFTVFQNRDLFIYRKMNWSSLVWWPRVFRDRPPSGLTKVGHFQKHLAIE